MTPRLRASLAAALLAALCPVPARAGSGPGSVQELERAFVEVNRKLAPCVVSLVVTGAPAEDTAKLPLEEKVRRFFGEEPHYGYKLRGVGSGLIIDPQGYILTNAHVLENVEEVTAILQDGRRLPGRIIGRAPHRDLGLLKVEAGAPLPAAAFADVSKLRVGQFAIALGNPFGLASDPEPTMTVGHISALRRTIPAPGGEYEFTNVIQTDAAINPGNSGGPLVNIDGEVIGISAAIFTTSGGSIGIGFAIPMDAPTLGLIDQLKRGSAPQVGWIGITRLQALTPALARRLKIEPGAGLLVVEVAADGPAARAGIRADDVLVSVDGRKLTAPAQVAELVQASAPGRELQVEVVRGAERLRLRLRVEARSFDAGETLSSPRAWRGLEVEDMTKADKLARGLAADVRGVLVSRVAKDSPAARAGLKQGDVIVKINQTEIPSAKQFRQATQTINPTEAALIRTLERVVAVEGASR